MRTLIVSDIHSNIHALDAVFAHAEEDEPVDNVICLGDTVGYGPSPMACLERLWERHAISILGNHDAAAVGILDTSDFNIPAAEANRWNAEQLTDDAREYLKGLPERLVDDPFLLVHGTPKEPLWEYLTTYGQAVEAWEYTDTSDVLVGHSHIQFACVAGSGIEQAGPEGFNIPLGHARLVVNPGSVGQPRDRDPRAAYAIYDDESRFIKLHRVWYDIVATQRDMAEAGLPEPLISRLSVGR
ncbi:MAG: metallophosphoesterase family protein [Chloroflexi bacterium]|nr:metallophosphoesterase family protein [Chloroflexota bacterium]